MKTIEISQADNLVSIKSPYDGELIEAIKEIHYKLRNWEYKTSSWIIDIDESDLSDLNTLDRIRKICADSVERNNWLLIDKTVTDDSEAIATVETIHYDLLLKVLDKLPTGSLVLVDWINKTKSGLKNVLTIELQSYLEDQELFQELKQASLKVSRKNFGMYGLGFQEKGTIGRFQFDVLANLEILQQLTKLKTKNLNLNNCKLIKSFNDGIHHLKDDQETLYVGYKIDDFQLDSVTFSNSIWTIGIDEDNEIYFIENVERLFIHFCERNTSIFWIGGIGHPGDDRGIVTKEFEAMHLEDWLENKVISLTEGEIKVDRYCKSKYRIYDYDHPFDIVSDNLYRFSFSEEGLAFVNTKKAEIKAKKLEMLNQAITLKSQEIKDNAIAYTENYTKPELMKFCEKFNIEIKKSWNKTKLAEAMVLVPEWIDYLIKQAVE